MVNDGPECYQCGGTGKLQHGNATGECWFCDGQGHVESFAEWLKAKNPPTGQVSGAVPTGQTKSQT